MFSLPTIALVWALVFGCLYDPLTVMAEVVAPEENDDDFVDGSEMMVDESDEAGPNELDIVVEDGEDHPLGQEAKPIPVEYCPCVMVDRWNLRTKKHERWCIPQLQDWNWFKGKDFEPHEGLEGYQVGGYHPVVRKNICFGFRCSSFE
jgi:hypothetical protein